MKLIGYETARSALYYNPEEVRALTHMAYGPAVIQAIVDRYQFAFPPDPAELKADTVTFKTGMLVTSTKQIVIPQFFSMNGGLFADALTTDDADEVLDDAVAHLTKEFDLRAPVTPFKRGYLSSLVVEFDAPAAEMIRGVEAISKVLSKAMAEYYGTTTPVALARVSFNCDPEHTPRSIASTDFVIERRNGVPYQANRFFCQSPFRTQDHVTLLEEIERAYLSAK